MRIRPDEEYCKEAFDRHLRTNGWPRGPEWEKVPQENEPPDYYLRGAGPGYAVEVMAIIPMYERGADRPISEIGLSVMISRLASQVEAAAVDAGTLRGAYVFWPVNPFDHFVESQHEVRDVLLQFIADTSSVEEVPWTHLRAASGQQVEVMKHPSKTNSVGEGFMSCAGGWESETFSQLLDLVSAAVVGKAGKLTAVPAPRILLLLDQHWVAGGDVRSQVREHLASTTAGELRKATDCFHSIYLVGERHEEVYRLFPRKEPAWGR